MLIKSYELPKKNLDLLSFFLIYGENYGSRKDSIKSILNNKEKKNGKYKNFDFEEEEILKNQNDFYNLIFSGSLFDAKKIILINRVSDKIFKIISEISNKKIDDILLILTSDRLEKKSKIRNLFEKDKNLACIACYHDTNISLIKIINEEIKKLNISLSNESINLIIERAMGDRNNLRNEINKLKSLNLSKKNISYQEIKELTNLAENYQNEYIVNICLNGEKNKLKKALNENNFLVDDFFIILKILSKKIHRLIKIKLLGHSEKNLEKVLGQIKPPIFWKEKDDVKKQIFLWNEKKLSITINKINEIELLCKKNHEVATNIMLDFLSGICDEISNYS